MGTEMGMLTPVDTQGRPRLNAREREQFRREQLCQELEWKRGEQRAIQAAWRERQAQYMANRNRRQMNDREIS